jgi:hypothetical protein
LLLLLLLTANCCARCAPKMGGKSSKKLSKEDMSFLMDNTNFTKQQIKAWYKGFMVGFMRRCVSVMRCDMRELYRESSTNLPDFVISRVKAFTAQRPEFSELYDGRDNLCKPIDFKRGS